MGQSFHALWVHLVWSTKHRQPLIVPQLKFRLYELLRDVAKEQGYHLDFINGVEDHVHLLVGLQPKFAVSEVVKNLKGISHTRIREQQWSSEFFNWQDGYAAISVSPDRVPVVRGYIRKQEKHHQRVDFESEWRVFEQQALVFPNS